VRKAEHGGAEGQHHPGTVAEISCERIPNTLG
jgi:hypothetical protein